MPSSWSASLRFELQFTGENINLWGDKLNADLSHVDFSIAGWLTKALVGDYTLTTANAGDDEARAAMLKFTGGGPFTVTIPSVSKNYSVWNACSGLVTITTGAGTAAVIQSGEVMHVICDGSNVKRVVPTDFAAARLTSVAYPIASTDAANRQYVDDTAFNMAAGALPGQASNAGKALMTNGTTASWGGGLFSPVPLSAGMQLLNSAGVQLGGVLARTDGLVGLTDASGAFRLQTDATGTAYGISATGATMELATVAKAIALAIAL